MKCQVLVSLKIVINIRMWFAAMGLVLKGLTVTRIHPAKTQRRYNVAASHDVAATLYRSLCNVVCLLCTRIDNSGPLEHE